VSDDRDLDGQPIKRVQITNIGFRALFPGGKAEFVNQAQVRITCVPSALAKEFPAYSNLPEIPFEESSEESEEEMDS
jgi:hypothetical protein